MLYQKLDFFISHGKGQLNDVTHFFPIDGYDLIPGDKFQFLCQTVRMHSEDNARVLGSAHFILAHRFFL